MSSLRHHYCTICEKNYSSRQSLSRHKKTFHTNVVIEPSVGPQNRGKMAKITSSGPQNLVENLPETSKIICKFCKKTYSRKDNLNRHLKICKEKDNIDNIKKENEILKKELLKLINKKCKIHPKTLEKMCRDNNITINKNIDSSNSHNTINSHNNTVNNTVNIITFGLDSNEIHDALTVKEKKAILNYGSSSLYKLVEHVHFNDKFPQFKNFAITNINNPYAYKYNSKKKQFMICSKEDLLDELIDTRMLDIDEFYSIYGDTLDDYKKMAIEKLIQDMEQETGDIITNYKQRLKFMVYNSSKNMEVE
jgi:septum formation topological specificity factor MinE